MTKNDIANKESQTWCLASFGIRQISNTFRWQMQETTIFYRQIQDYICPPLL